MQERERLAMRSTCTLHSGPDRSVRDGLLTQTSMSCATVRIELSRKHTGDTLPWLLMSLG